MLPSEPVSLEDAAGQFLASHPSGNAAEFHQELQRFLRWYGREKPVSELTPWAIEAYGETIGADSGKKLGPVKTFLGYLRKEGLTSGNLGIHLKVKKGSFRAGGERSTPPPSAIRLMKESYTKMEAELEELKKQRIHVAQEVKRAREDKDFRENAPLDAAREQQGYLEARIRKLEQILGSAEIVDKGETRPESQRARLGSLIVMRDLADGEVAHYIIADPHEADPAQGKISIESPIGKSLINRFAGEVVEVKAPAGAFRYLIERIVG